MGRFQRPHGSRNGVDRDFTKPGEEGPFDHTRRTKESECHGPANVHIQAQGAQRAGQEHRTDLNMTAVQPKRSNRRRRQQRSVSPPPGFPLPGAARAPQPARNTIAPAGRDTQRVPKTTAVSPPPGFPLPGAARAPQPTRSTIAPAGRATQHASRSTPVEQGPAERLPQVPQRFQGRLVFPEGRAITQALNAARGDDKTQNAAPTPAIIASKANAKQASNKVVLKQQATARSASSSSASTPRAPPTPPQPSLPISHQGVPEAAAAAVACLQPVSAPVSTLGGSSSDEAGDSGHNSAIVSQMFQGTRKKARGSRPPPGVRKRMAAEAAEREAAGAQLAALAVAHLRAAAAAADAAQAAADQAAERAAAGAQLAALAVARLRAAAAAADAQAAAVAADFVMLTGAAEAYMEAKPAAVASMGLPHTASGWVYYCAGAVTGLADGLISLRR